MDWIKENYFKFDGRLPRWQAFKLQLLLCVPFLILATVFGIDTVMIYVYSLICMIGGLSVTIRRLHDLNRSGWFILIGFIPVVNFFYYIYVLFFKGTEGANKYGPDPLQM